MQTTVTHGFQRFFQADKIKPPRDFVQPDLTQLATTPLFLEIGAGKGMHALQFAQANPQKHLFAVERTKEKYNAFAKQAAQVNSENLQVIHADVIAWLVHALPCASLAGVFILYPNPEPHNKNQRWLNMPFFEFLLSRLQANASIVLATNIADYMEETIQQAKNTWHLAVHKTKVPAQSARTHFEKKYLARGEPCWQVTLTKPKDYVTRFDNQYNI